MTSILCSWVKDPLLSLLPDSRFPVSRVSSPARIGGRVALPETLNPIITTLIPLSIASRTSLFGCFFEKHRDEVTVGRRHELARYDLDLPSLHHWSHLTPQTVTSIVHTGFAETFRLGTPIDTINRNWMTRKNISRQFFSSQFLSIFRLHSKPGPNSTKIPLFYHFTGFQIPGKI